MLAATLSVCRRRCMCPPRPESLVRTCWSGCICGSSCRTPDVPPSSNALVSLGMLRWGRPTSASVSSSTFVDGSPQMSRKEEALAPIPSGSLEASEYSNLTAHHKASRKQHAQVTSKSTSQYVAQDGRHPQHDLNTPKRTKGMIPPFSNLNGLQMLCTQIV